MNAVNFFTGLLIYPASMISKLEPSTTTVVVDQRPCGVIEKFFGVCDV